MPSVTLFQTASISNLSLPELAREYTLTIYSPANGWGQHVHPTYGISHNIMKYAYAKFGERPAMEAIGNAMAEYLRSRASVIRNKRHEH